MAGNPTQSLYAWDLYEIDFMADPPEIPLGVTYYTLTETITTEEQCYDEYGQQINASIDSSGNVRQSGGKTGYTAQRNSTKDIIVVEAKPEHLYGWTDNSITETQMFAWTTSSTSIANNNNVPTTFYTTTATPSTSSKIYDENGNDITSLFNDGYKYFTSSSSSVMTWFYASGGGGVII